MWQQLCGKIKKQVVKLCYNKVSYISSFGWVFFDKNIES